jgi:hypothetical protein
MAYDSMMWLWVCVGMRLQSKSIVLNEILLLSSREGSCFVSYKLG